MSWRRRTSEAGGSEAGLPEPSRAASPPEALVRETVRGGLRQVEGPGGPRITSRFGLPVLGHGKVDPHWPHGDRLLGLGKEASSPSRRAAALAETSTDGTPEPQKHV